MSWGKLRDQQINNAVEKICGMHCEDLNGKYIPSCDYCNNWADMGPLIEKHGIFLACSQCPAGSGYAYYAVTGDFCSEYQSSYCRAAAIVFLMMNGVKPEDIQ